MICFDDRTLQSQPLLKLQRASLVSYLGLAATSPPVHVLHCIRLKFVPVSNIPAGDEPRLELGVHLFGIMWNYLEIFGITRKFLELLGNFWNYLEIFGITWKFLKLLGNICNYLKYLELLRNIGNYLKYLELFGNIWKYCNFLEIIGNKGGSESRCTLY